MGICTWIHVALSQDNSARCMTLMLHLHHYRLRDTMPCYICITTACGTPCHDGQAARHKRASKAVRLLDF